MNWVVHLFLPLAAIIGSFGVGLGVVPGHLYRPIRQPRELVIGLLIQLVAVPLSAYLACISTGASAETMLGIFILAASPISVSAPMLTRLARGDAALSITLMSLTFVLAVPVLPLTLNLLSNSPQSAHVAVPLARMIAGLLLVATVPAILGSLVRWRWPVLAERLDRRFPMVAMIILLALVATVIVGQWQELKASIAQAGLTAVVFNIYAIVVSLIVCRTSRMSPDQRIAVTLGAAMRHTAISAFVALTLLNRAELVLPAFAYGLCMWISGPLVMLLLRGGTESAVKPSFGGSSPILP